MSSQTSVELIKELCDAFGPSGREESVAELIKKKIANACPNAVLDRMGNLIAPMRFGDLNATNRKKVMVSAHMDEVGFMINEIKSNGLLGFDMVGGISDSVIAGRKVKLLSKKGLISGVIASKAIHHKDKKERETATKIDSLYIDIGLCEQDQVKEYVSIGDFAVFDSEFYTFGKDLVKAKALDDRMGCAAMIETIFALKEKPIAHDLDVFFCFTVREEIGLSGAQVAAYRIRPDAAIILETTAIADIDGTAPSQRVADVGEGVVISLMDRSTIYDRSLVDLAFKTSKATGVKAQVKRYVSGGNDAGNIHKTAEGIKTLAMSVPTRYLHSPACVASINDYHSQQRLCEEILRAFC